MTKQQAIINAMIKKDKTPVWVRVYAVVLTIVLAAISSCEQKQGDIRLRSEHDPVHSPSHIADSLNYVRGKSEGCLMFHDDYTITFFTEGSYMRYYPSNDSLYISGDTMFLIKNTLSTINKVQRTNNQWAR